MFPRQISSPPASAPLAFLAGLAIALLFSSCGSGSKAPVALQTSVAVAKASSSGTEGAIYEGINAYRSQRGLPAQRRHSGLDRMARQHAQKMAREAKFEHSNIEYAEEMAKRRYRLFNVEENILRASRLTEDQLPAIAMENWVNSRGHRINVETQNTQVGIGVVQAPDGSFYACAITATPMLRSIEADRLERSYGVREGEFEGIGW